MLSEAELRQANQLITDADRVMSELHAALEATRAQLSASRKVAKFIPGSESLSGEALQDEASAASKDKSQN